MHYFSGCGPYGFECGDGDCIYIGFRCDGKSDCLDDTDELGCEYIFICKSHQYVRKQIIFIFAAVNINTTKKPEM